uniref:Zinc finger protein GLIS2 n=1 Tax=Sus scrofa TaxID=9823 RepID=A0A8D0ULJ7_PIG
MGTAYGGVWGHSVTAWLLCSPRFLPEYQLGSPPLPAATPRPHHHALLGRAARPEAEHHQAPGGEREAGEDAERGPAPSSAQGAGPGGRQPHSGLPGLPAFRLPAEPQVPREGRRTLFGSPPGGPQLVTAIWAGLPQWQQLTVPGAPGQRGPVCSTHWPRPPAAALSGRRPQFLPVPPAPGLRGGPAPACLLLPPPAQGQVPLARAAPAQAAGVSLGQGERGREEQGQGLGRVAPGGFSILPAPTLQCNQPFELLQDLVDHVNDYHVKPEKDAGYCCHWEGCARHGRGFNARYKMLIHIRTHTNEKPHRCPTCSKSFSRLENLKIHNRSHTGEKPYVCPYEGCNKRYSNSSDRFKHTRTHYVDKPYYCKMPGCHKRYTDPSSLRKHIKAHGHFVSHEQQELLQLRPPPKPPLPAPDGSPYVSGAQIIIPNPAALFGGPGLPGLPLPLAPGPLDLSALACGNGGGGGGAGGMGPGLPGPVLPLNLAKSPLLPSPFGAGGLGLPVVSLLAGSAGGKAEGEKGRGAMPARALGMEGRKTPLERTESSRSRPSPDGLPLLPGTVLDLSTGVNSAASSPEALTPGWVVIPPGSVLLKPAVVN